MDLERDESPPPALAAVRDGASGPRTGAGSGAGTARASPAPSEPGAVASTDVGAVTLFDVIS